MTAPRTDSPLSKSLDIKKRRILPPSFGMAQTAFGGRALGEAQDILLEWSGPGMSESGNLFRGHVGGQDGAFDL